jgi:hypothetical protein
MRLRLDVRRRRGDAVLCPVCGSRFDRFKDDWNRADALCWRCGSHERHRAQWLLLENRPELLAQASSLLHFAPEWALRRRLQTLQRPRRLQIDSGNGGRRPFRYVTTDLNDPDVDVQLDITKLDLPDASFDAAICSHVLEHVDDDRAAMRELRRITAPGGWCLVMVPLDVSRGTTYEDPTIVDPQARQQAFWQFDHVRLYAPDIGDRLGEAGFDVERIRPREEFGDEQMRRCRLLEADELWLCRPPAR